MEKLEKNHDATSKLLSNVSHFKQTTKYQHTVMDNDYLTSLLVKLLTILLNNHFP